MKYFGGVRALNGASLQLNEGEVVGLVGDNGAGKSTLFKVLSGVLEPDEATFRCAGREVSVRSVKDANSLGIYTVYQDLALCDNLDVVSNLFLGTEIKRPLWQGARLDRAAMEAKSRQVLTALGVKIPSLSVLAGKLSGGQRQGVAIARAVLRNPRLVLMDEPTAALGVEQTAHVLEMIRRLRSEGRGVAVVSHNLRDVIDVADRVVVLRLGQVVREFRKDEFIENELVAAITGTRATTEKNQAEKGGA